MNQKKELKFFIVDDDHFCAMVYEQYLKNLNYSDVTFFDNGEDCLDFLHHKPDIIFLDHNMGDLTGFEVLKKIKRYDPNIYVVIVSGQDKMNIAIEALKHGAFDYLIKDSTVCKRMSETINRIKNIQEEIDRSNKKGILRFFSIF